MANLLGTTTIGGHQAIHVGNISSYSGITQAAADGRYLLLSGGTLSGNLVFPNDSAVGLRNADGSAGFRPDDQYGNIYTWNSSGGYYVDANSYYLRNTAGSVNWLSITGSGTVQANADFRAPIFYDSSDTNYYVDPNSNSRLVNLGLGGVTPDVRLSVSGDGHLSGYLYLGGSAGSASSWGTRTVGTSGVWITNSSTVRFDNVGYGNNWSFNINSAGAITINRHIDANTVWGLAGVNTIFVGWYGGKIVLGNNNDGAHDYANSAPGNSIISTNKHYFGKGAAMQNNVQGAEVLSVDGVNGRLFTVTDDLSDSLFSVNTIAGLPVIEAFADNTIKIGKYGSNSITIANSKIAINSDSVDSNFPFYVGDRSTASSRYSLANPGMGFNLADNYAQLQLFGGNGAYIDFVTSTGQDSGGRIMWNGNFVISGNTYFNNTLYTYTLYDRDDQNYYIDMNGTSRLGTVNMNQLSVYGNTYLGDGNGDTTYINDTLYIGANDSGDSHLYFGEGSSPGSDYGVHWYWDSGVTFYWYTRNNGTDRALFNYSTSDTTYLYWHRHFHMNNYEINYLNQIHFNDNVWFTDDGNNQYLNYHWGNSAEGGIKFVDGGGSLQGYVYGSGSGSFGLLDSSGNWKVRIDTSTVELYGTQYATNIYANTFYDRDNSDFYLNVAESSRVRNLYVGDSESNWSDPGGWGTQFHVSNGPHAIIRVYARDESIETVLFSHNEGQSKVGSGTNHDFAVVRNFVDRMTFYSGYTYSAGYFEAADSLRAPIFYDSNDTNYYLDPSSTETSFRGRGEILLGPNTSGQYTRLGGNGGSVDHATVSASNGNLHIDCKNNFGLYLNYYSRDTIYLGQSGAITDDGTYYNGTAAAANSVAWTNVSSRPTALSQFTNDLGNYGGFLTSLPSHNHDDRYYTESEIDSQISNRLYQARVNGLNVNAFNATGLYRGSTSDWSNRPTITHNGGALLTIDTHPSDYHSQLFFDTGGDRLYFRNANGGSWGSWLTMLHSGNYTSYSPSLTGGGASGTWSINVTGTAARATRANGNFYIDDNYGVGVVGLYDAARYQGVFAMGDSYKLPANGTSTGSLYGLAWSHPNAGGVAGNLNTHGLLVMENGAFLAAISGSIRSRDDMRAPIFYDQNDTNYYLDPNGTSNLLQLTTSTRARWNMPRWWTDRSSITSDQNYWTGSNGWGVDQGTWANAWKGGFSGWDIWGTNTEHPQGSGYIHAQGIVSGQHLATSDGSSGYGWMMVGAADAVANRYWLRGKWSSTTSEWVEMITTGNVGSQSVSYAASAGAVAWTNVSSRPTALSQFTNDLGNYGGFLTSLPAHDHDRVFLTDSRGASRAPSYYDQRYAQWDFQNTSDTGAGGDSWHGLLTVAKWSSYDSSHRQEQLAFTGDDLKRRTATSDSAWGSWKTIIDSGNIGSQSVNYATSAGFITWTNVGSRPTALSQFTNDLGNYGGWQSASTAITTSNIGSQSVNYATSAGSATSADQIDGRGFRNTGSNDATNADTIESNGITYYQFGVTNFSGNATDGALYSQAYSSSWQHQIAGDYRSGQIAVRGKNDGTWRAWRTVLDSENYATWAIARGGDTVSGSIYFLSNRGATLGATDTAPLQAYATGGNAAFMSFHRSGSYAVNMGLDSDNVFRIGGWSASANRLQMDMSGNLTMAGDVIAFSDARVKTNVQTIEGALEKTLKLRGVTYNRIDSDDTATKLGVIAQEVLEIIPEVVTLDNNGTYGVSYGNIVGLLIEAIKEQQAQIDDLKKQLNK